MLADVRLRPFQALYSAISALFTKHTESMWIITYAYGKECDAWEGFAEGLSYWAATWRTKQGWRCVVLVHSTGSVKRADILKGNLQGLVPVVQRIYNQDRALKKFQCVSKQLKEREDSSEAIEGWFVWR